MTSEIIPNPFQLVHLTKSLSNRGLLICDGVGVGKTISSGYIAAFHVLVQKQPAAVVCPPMLVEKWRVELREKFSIASVKIGDKESFESALEDAEARSRLNSAIVYVIPYSLLSRSLIERAPELSLLIFDEIHNLRNPETNSYTSALMLARRSQHKVGLSATPFQNTLHDLSAELSLVYPEYPRATLDAALIEIWSMGRTEILRPWITRFEKEHLGIHFSKRAIQNQLIRYPSEYATAVEELVDRASRSSRGGTRGSALENITRFRLAASSPAAFYASFGLNNPIQTPDAKAAALLTVLREERHERWLVFCEFVETAKEVVRCLEPRPVVLITGETHPDLRPALLQSFRDTPSSVLVLTAVGSEGLDLQSCSRVVNYDLHWNPMVLEQRIGRVDRIGQEKKVIQVVNFIVDGSIDERIIRVLGRKLAAVTGTVVEPAVVIQNSARVDEQSSTRLTIVDEELIEDEVDSARKLIDTQALRQKLPSGDYELAAAIPTEFCDPRGWSLNPEDWSAGPPWLSSSKSASHWAAEHQRALATLIEFVEQYS
jgi:SNF2 family DNA or RNA helicase